MKTLIAKFSGELAPGGMVILSYSSPRGGRSDAKHANRNAAAQSAADVAAGLAGSINGGESSEWCGKSGDFKATPRGDSLYVQCSDLVDNVRFSCEVIGGGLDYDLKELGRAAA